MRRLSTLILVVLIAASAHASDVDDPGDAPDAAPGNGVCLTAGAVCTLRAAIEEANASAGPDVITFSIAGVITPGSALPSITGTVVIDGTTAPGYAGSPVVIVDGAGGIGYGLDFAPGSDSSVLDGLKIHGFSAAAVRIQSDLVEVYRNYLGPVGGGTINVVGLEITGSNSQIGDLDGSGNVISGNEAAGITVTGTGHVIRDNLIGTDAAGTAALGNGSDGIHVFGAASGITIGGTVANQRNVITGNVETGVLIDGGNAIIVAGNFIGLDVTGTAGIGNGDFGIFVDSAANVQIGGLGAGEGNVISFNGIDGIGMDTVTDSRIYGNTIGLDAAGTAPRGNGGAGITVFDSTNVSIGAPAGGRNIVSDNFFGGIILPGGSGHTVENNYVGTNLAGTTALGNLDTGILVIFSDNNTIRANLVSGNAGHGIEMTLGSLGTIIHSNIIGLSADLATPMPNGGDGVNVCDGAADTVVGSAALGGNTIANNGASGIGVEPTALLNNTWAANSIYDNTDLGIDLNIDGVTSNDADDTDLGANNLQNFPTLASAVTTGTASQVRGTINSTPNTTITVDVYSSPGPDPSGFGEGRTYLGSTAVMTDGGGNASFIVTGAAATVGSFVTATATAPAGTSEFCEAMVAGAAPTVQFSSANFADTEAAGSATITVTRTGDLNAISTVQYATSDGTAGSADYTTASGTLTFAPTESFKTFTVAITNDALDEPSETVMLTLSNPTAATLGAQSTAQLTILDDDPAPGISINDVTLAEGNAGATSFTFTISLTAVSGQQVRVDYATADGTATAGVDYAAAAGTAIIAAGSLSTQVTVTVSGDTLFEPSETFFVNLTAPVNAAIADPQGAGTITNDDAMPADVSITKTGPANVTANVPFDYTITVSNAGPAAATGVTMTDALPPQVTFVSATPSQGSCNGTSTVICDLGTLAPAGTATVTIRVVTDLSGLLTPNTATVVASEPDPDPANNTDTVVILIPTLSQWVLIALALTLAGVAVLRIAR